MLVRVKKPMAATNGYHDAKPSRCPDPVDPSLQLAGPIVVGKLLAHLHRLYIPFLRSTPGSGGALMNCAPHYQLYIAYSNDGGNNWMRSHVAVVRMGSTRPAIRGAARSTRARSADASFVPDGIAVHQCVCSHAVYHRGIGCRIGIRGHGKGDATYASRGNQRRREIITTYCVFD